MVDWMMRAALMAALLGLSAAALEGILVARRGPTRVLWLMAMLLSMALPVLATVLPPLRPHSLSVLAPFDAAAFAIVLRESGVVAAGDRVSSGLRLLPFLWLTASGFLALRYGWSWWRLSRRVTHARVVPLAGTMVWLTSGFGPAIVGLRRARIVIPGWVLSLSEEQKRMVTRHEREHLRARDHWILALAPLAVIAFPWNAALWWQLFRLRRSIELDCDARVLQSGVPARAYGALLLEVASKPVVGARALPAMAGSGRLLRQRLQVLLRPAHRASGIVLSMRLALGLTSVLLGLLIVVPAARPVLAQRARSFMAHPSRAQPDPAIVIDATVMRPGSLVDVVVDRIVGFEELDPASAAARFGADARNGAIVIRTTNKSFVMRSAAAAGSNSLDITVRLRGLDNLSMQSGLLDVRRIGSIGLSLGRLGNVLASEVLSVRVLKGNAMLLGASSLQQQGTIQLVLRSDYLERLRLAR